jgi:hypothetical protein
VLKISLVEKGHATLEQSGTAVDIRAGEFVMYDTAKPYRFIKHTPW